MYSFSKAQTNSAISELSTFSWSREPAVLHYNTAAWLVILPSSVVQGVFLGGSLNQIDGDTIDSPGLPSPPRPPPSRHPPAGDSRLLCFLSRQHCSTRIRAKTAHPSLEGEKQFSELPLSVPVVLIRCPPGGIIYQAAGTQGVRSAYLRMRSNGNACERLAHKIFGLGGWVEGVAVAIRSY